ASATTQQTVDLSWLDNAQNESGFEVQSAAGACSATSTFSTVAQLDAGATAYRHTGLAEGATFCYRVRATSRYLVNGVPVVSDWTLPVEATTLPPPPPYVCSAQPYSWVDMTGGTVLALGDDASAAVSLPFAFPFYGAPRTSVLVSSNGFIQFVEGPANEYQNSALPGTALPNGIIAAFWDDLNPSAATGSGQVRVRTVGTTPGARQFAIAWEGVPHFDVAGNPVTAQIVLDEASGQIALNYQDVLVGSALIDRGASATVGLENPAGNSATQIGFNQAVLSDLSSYQCGIDVPAPPAVPGGLSATAASTSAINVVWTDVANETGYTLELSGTSGITEVALGAGVTQYSHTGLAASSTWSYRVRASNANGLSAWSSTATATTQSAAPTTPGSVAATARSSTSIRVTWGNVANETRFEVERTGPAGTAAPNPSIVSVAADILTYDHTVTAGQTWSYRVRAVNNGGPSAWSASVSASTPATAVPPSNVNLAQTGTTASISWTDNASNE
ncbi:MAG: fibronectin type III domain-containing protein, partial [Gammaproteobacteria bacterium]